jgi:hypothetical protein
MHVMRLAITGHRELPPATARLVDNAVRAWLAALPAPVTAVTSLADGADQIAARAVLDTGGALEVIIPAARYRDGLPAETRAAYDALLGQASAVDQLGYDASTSDAHMAASEAMLETADYLLAIWDGRPARGFGGTADVVAVARSRSVPVTVIWPDGATRDG